MIASPLTDDESDWAVCDTAARPESTTTVMAAADGADRLDPKRSVLVTPHPEGCADVPAV